ncbi:MAG: NADH oxidase, partial [Myxococcota bacterium]
MTDYSPLFSPIRIGTMELRNRLVMSPMENSFGTQDGRPTERSIQYFEARAKGGVGLITLGASSIDEKHKEVPASLHFASDSVISDHRALVDAVHAHGAKIQPQIAHAGPDGLGPEMHQVEALGPSGVQSYLTGTTSKAIT